jgi:hypothetical protein
LTAGDLLCACSRALSENDHRDQTYLFLFLRRNIDELIHCAFLRRTGQSLLRKRAHESKQKLTMRVKKSFHNADEWEILSVSLWAYEFGKRTLKQLRDRERLVSTEHF